MTRFGAGTHSMFETAPAHALEVYWFRIMVTSSVQLARSLAQDFPLGTLSP